MAATITTPKRWTRREINIVRRNYGKRTFAEIAEMLGRTPGSVKSYVSANGIAQSRRFTNREKAYVRKNCRKKTAAEIAERLGRSESGIHQLANRMGLARKRVSLGDDFEEFLRAKHKAGWSDAEIAAAWGCDRHTVGDFRDRFGLPHNALSERRRDRVRKKTAEQLRKAGLPTLAAVRVKAFRDRARAAGWPEDLRPRAVQILNALWDNGPMSRREIADAIGMPWKGTRESLCSNDPEGSYLAHLAARRLVVVLKRARRVTGKGRGHSVNLYSLPLDIQRGPILEKEESRDCKHSARSNGSHKKNRAASTVDASAT